MTFCLILNSFKKILIAAKAKPIHQLQGEETENLTWVFCQDLTEHKKQYLNLSHSQFHPTPYKTTHSIKELHVYTCTSTYLQRPYRSRGTFTRESRFVFVKIIERE